MADMDITLRVGVWPFRRERTFRGSCTVWHDVETGRRAGTSLEARLADLCWFAKQKKTGVGYDGKFVTIDGKHVETWLPYERNPSKLICHRWTGKAWESTGFARFVPIPQFNAELAAAMADTED